ncbi:MAG: glycosyltransferase family 1 protein, partial [Bacteroidaceae bacterium]|nr:glycosyltransferase family 1 protein [Bacteroidaceae bacterium]
MKILLLGEYSNVHNTLALGLRALGQQVCVASDGDGWKNYPRDIDLSRENKGKGTFLFNLIKSLPHMKGYDVVQLINPMFLELKAEHIEPIYRFLRRHNGKIVLGAF